MVLEQTEEQMQQAIEHLKEQLQNLRGSRASIHLFDRVHVDCYGHFTPLSQMANISIPEARQIIIQPWDQSTMVAIEKAILNSDLSLTPQIQGNKIRIQVPTLSAERRQQLVKQVKQLGEASKVSIRSVRHKMNEDLKQQNKDKQLSDDDLEKALNKVQVWTDEFVKKVDECMQVKEMEILEN